MSKFDMRTLLAENKRLKAKVEELERQLKIREGYSKVMDEVFEKSLEWELKELEDVEL